MNFPGYYLVRFEPIFETKFFSQWILQHVINSSKYFCFYCPALFSNHLTLSASNSVFLFGGGIFIVSHSIRIHILCCTWSDSIQILFAIFIERRAKFEVEENSDYELANEDRRITRRRFEKYEEAISSVCISNWFIEHLDLFETVRISDGRGACRIFQNLNELYGIYLLTGSGLFFDLKMYCDAENFCSPWHL